LKWKVAFLICLTLFVASVITNVITATLISLQSLLSSAIESSTIALDVDSSGDPIDDPWPPHSLT
jgi:hypothetical protein